MSTEWKSKYPLVTVQALDRGVSDHTPLLLDTGAAAFAGNCRQFKLELGWFHREDFHDRVVEIWNRPVKGRNVVQRWNNKMSALRRHLRGWAAHTCGTYKLEKAHLQATIDALDINAEIQGLSDIEREQLAQSRDQLARILREEELKWYQRAKTSDGLLGDNNTKYFHLVAMGSIGRIGFLFWSRMKVK